MLDVRIQFVWSLRRKDSSQGKMEFVRTGLSPTELKESGPFHIRIAMEKQALKLVPYVFRNAYAAAH
jgi:hypothetical protein